MHDLIENKTSMGEGVCAKFELILFREGAITKNALNYVSLIFCKCTCSRRV